MPKQTLEQRVTRLLSDAAQDETVDLRARWQKIVDDGPGEPAVAALGPMPVPTLDAIPLQEAVDYAARDADATLRVYPYLRDKVREMGLERALALDLACIPMVARMCQNGVRINLDHLKVLDEVFQDNLMDLEYRAYSLASRRFLLTSGDQVAEVLYEDLALSGVRKTKSGKRLSTDEKALKAIEGRHPIVKVILEHREISKLKSSYVDTLPHLVGPDGRWCFELGMSTVPSGRLNGWGGVNPLAIPVRSELGREIRGCFIADPGHKLCSIDLNQIELRALAILSKDPVMRGSFLADRDLHRLTASELFGAPFDKVTFDQRQRGKTINFAIANQITAPGLLDQYIISGLLDLTVEDAQHDLDNWFHLYNSVPAFFEAVYEEGRKNGFIRDVLSGRILWTPGLRSDIEKVESEAKRIATNWKIQTFAQVIIKMGMVKIWELICNGFDMIRPILQIHDEILLEIPEDMALPEIGRALTDTVVRAAPKLPIPILAGCKFGNTWSELK